MNETHETRRISASIFGNEKLAEIVLLLDSEDGAVLAADLARRTGFSHSLVRDVLIRLGRTSAVRALPKTGNPRGPACGVNSTGYEPSRPSWRPPRASGPNKNMSGRRCWMNGLASPGILARTLGGLVIQLDAADALLGEGDDPEGGRHLVGGARRLAVEGLEEARQAIAALRTDPVDLPEALAFLTVGDARPGPVSYELRGAPRRLAPDASLAVYRTAQEALANARKHAPGAAVAMKLSFEDRAAVLQVANDTPPGSSAGHPADLLALTGGGYGLRGLTERAELLGGTLHVGPSEDGWIVELRVPG